MSFANKHNQAVRLFAFEIPESFEFRTLKELYESSGKDAVHKVNMIYINKKGKYGHQPVIATDSELVNFPKHTMENILEVLEDAESVNLINNGHVGFKIYTYQNDDGEFHAPEWVDID